MKRVVSVLLYIVICSYLFGWIDWQVIHLTRWTHPEWKDWMHEHEKAYAFLTRPIETFLCTPAMALKPIFHEMSKRVEASQEEQDAVTHAPPMNWKGFYQLHDRNTSWTFTPWWAWFLYWTLPSLIWFYVVSHLILPWLRR